MANLEALEPVLNEKFSAATTAEWMERLEEAGVPCGPVLDIAEMHRDPQTLAREMVVETEHPVAGPVKALGLPI
jgi:crotonobetainyl-CoA:carnitine CoA-transferase CaiB-like acyl-CoA transferase